MALVSLGLIDEVVYEMAMKTMRWTREEGLKEARERIDAANRRRREERRDRSRSLGRHSAEGREEQLFGKYYTAWEEKSTLTDVNVEP